MALPIEIYYVGAIFFGLIIGSFLNVVIYRLPLIEEGEDKENSLITPASHCVSCEGRIKPWHNIPLLSYLLLRGKCSYCGCKISLKYPLVELLSALLFLSIIMKWGISVETISLMLFTSFLIALSVIDIERHLLLDSLTLPLIWVGLFVNLEGIFTDITSAVLGTIIGYTSFWMIYHVYLIIRKKEVLGHGDFKLLAALGAWAGWQVLPLIILIASFSGLLLGLLFMLLSKGQKVAFGPYLSVAGWLVIMWGHDLQRLLNGLL